MNVEEGMDPKIREWWTLPDKVIRNRQGCIR